MPVKTKNKKSVKVEAKVKKSKKTKSPEVFVYCFHCQESQPVNDARVIQLYNSNRKQRLGTCAECGGKVAGMVNASTVADEVQTKSQYDARKVVKGKIAADKEAAKPKNKAAAKVETQKKVLATKVPKPELKRRDGESKSDFNARTERLWEKRKKEFEPVRKAAKKIVAESKGKKSKKAKK